MSCDKTYLNIKMEVEQDESHDCDHDLAKKNPNEYLALISEESKLLKDIKQVLETDEKISESDSKEILNFEFILTGLKASFSHDNAKINTQNLKLEVFKSKLLDSKIYHKYVKVKKNSKQSNNSLNCNPNTKAIVNEEEEEKEIKSQTYKMKLRKREEKDKDKQSISQVEVKSKSQEKAKSIKNQISKENKIQTYEEKQLQHELNELLKIKTEMEEKEALLERQLAESKEMAICKKKLEKDIENMIEEIYFNKNEIVEHDKKLLIINEENKELKKSMDDLSKKADNIDDKMKTLKDFNEIRSKEILKIEAIVHSNLISIIEDAFNDESSREELSTYLKLILHSTNSLCLQTITNIINSICDYLDPQNKQNKEHDTSNANSSLVKQTLTDFLYRFKDCIFNCSNKREEYIELVIKSIKFLYAHNLMPSEELYKEYSQNELNKRLQLPDFETL